MREEVRPESKSKENMLFVLLYAYMLLKLMS